MDNLEIANKIMHELNILEPQIKKAQRELNTLLREQETKLYFITLLEKEFTNQELEIFNKLKKRYENEI